MAKVDMKKVADGVFEKYPTQNTVFVTSDGTAFWKEMHAKNHAAAEKLGEVKKFERKVQEPKEDK